MRQAGQHDSNKKSSFSRCPRCSMEWPSAPEGGWLDLLCSWPALFSGQKSWERSRTWCWARWGSCVTQYCIPYNIVYVYMYNMQKYRMWNVVVGRLSIRKSLHWKMFGHLLWDGDCLDASWKVESGVPLAWNNKQCIQWFLCMQWEKEKAFWVMIFPWSIMTLHHWLQTWGWISLFGERKKQLHTTTCYTCTHTIFYQDVKCP